MIILRQPLQISESMRFHSLCPTTSWIHVTDATPSLRLMRNTADMAEPSHFACHLPDHDKQIVRKSRRHSSTHEDTQRAGRKCLSAYSVAMMSCRRRQDGTRRPIRQSKMGGLKNRGHEKPSYDNGCNSRRAPSSGGLPTICPSELISSHS